jgi:hypothetical protein
MDVRAPLRVLVERLGNRGFVLLEVGLLTQPRERLGGMLVGLLLYLGLRANCSRGPSRWSYACCICAWFHWCHALRPLSSNV